MFNGSLEELLIDHKTSFPNILVLDYKQMKVLLSQQLKKTTLVSIDEEHMSSPVRLWDLLLTGLVPF